MDALSRSFYVVRHAKAGSRGHWTGDDRLRPLSSKGFKQAEELVKLLRRFSITAIYSSPYLRCVQTVEPLARARKLELKTSIELAEGRIDKPGAHAPESAIDDPESFLAFLDTEIRWS